MGAGCSSPLKRFGVKKGKSARRDSSLFEVKADVLDNQAGDTNAHSQTPTAATKAASLSQTQHHRNLENEITIQSEVNEDQPSTTSCYTDAKVHYEETKVSEQSVEPRSVGAESAASSTFVGNAAARIMGLNGSFTPHDRHLLVSPALSPAPSTCYSPSPAASTPGYSSQIDLNDLNEVFKTITFGLPESHQDKSGSIRQPERPKSELHNHYSHQLVQTNDDLVDHITVVFIATDGSDQSIDEIDRQTGGTATNNFAELIASQIESSFRSICDEHLFNLRFLNLSQSHFSEYFHVNNHLDVAMKILRDEYQQNNQRMMIVLLNNCSQQQTKSTNTATSTTTTTSEYQILNKFDKKLLPTNIEAQILNRALSSPMVSQESKNLLKKWYNQVGNMYYLKPIYSIDHNISDRSKETRLNAWLAWLKDSNYLIQSLLEIGQEADVPVKDCIDSLFNTYLYFIMQEPSLQKRTLLIKNLTNTTGTSTTTPSQQPNQLIGGKDPSLNELARLLSDSNKLTLKKQMSDEELVKTIKDWTSEIFSKFVEGALEYRIVNGKHVPPFMNRQLFTELTTQRRYLEGLLDNVTECFETKCNTFYSNHLSSILSDLTNSSTQTISSPAPMSSEESSDSNANQPSSNHLVFISGPKGIGKSSLFAQAIKLSVQEFLNKAQIVYRFCNISTDSWSPMRLLRSICEQFCQTQGENIIAASYVYSARREILNALNKIISNQTSLMFIDGLDALDLSEESDLDWLCEIRSSARVKIFISLETDSALYKKALGSFTDATFIAMDPLTVNEWANIFISSAKLRGSNISANLHEDIKKAQSSSSPDKLTLTRISDCMGALRITQMNNELPHPDSNSVILQDDASEAVGTILTNLHYIVTPNQLAALIVAIDASRNGLTEIDLGNIMTTLSQQNVKSSTCDPGFRFSGSLSRYLLDQLKPWLILVPSDGIIKINLRENFKRFAISYYTKKYFPNIVQDVRDVMIEYFSRKSRCRSSKGNLFKSETVSVELKDRVHRAERRWLATQISEMNNLLVKTQPAKARDNMLHKHKFFIQFLYGVMPEEFIEDAARLKDISSKKSSSSDELQSLLTYIKQSVHPLRYDGSQIYSQIYCRAFDIINKSGGGKAPKSKKLSDIFGAVVCPPVNSLLPLSEASVNSFIKTRIGQPNPQNNHHSQVPSSTLLNASDAQRIAKTPSYSSYHQQQANQAPAKQRIYTIKDNHRHVIAVYPDSGCVAVLDIYEEKIVRKISNLDQPRDLRMIDQRRAVILCNRELRVYDLDSGEMLTQLKGVMNQKMPFFEIFDGNYVVALARNRMYVNMMNLNTGELETTFKVGEDRFLNSLLVSADGGICVCGDETQKPFPLLVWNLKERRLMYDLRLERHEFITKMSAISDDGHFVVSVCRQIGELSGQGSSNLASDGQRTTPNFIVIYDLSSGTLFKKWKPGLDSCSVAISISSNRSGKVINTIVDSSILVWDLSTGSKRHTLIGHSVPADIIQVQNGRLFSMDSTCRDQSLRIWDIEEGYCLAIFSPDAPINCCQISIRGDALVCGFAAETRLSTLIMCKNETVSEVVKRNKRRKSSKSLYIFDEPPSSRKGST